MIRVQKGTKLGLRVNPDNVNECAFTMLVTIDGNYKQTSPITATRNPQKTLLPTEIAT